MCLISVGISIKLIERQVLSYLHLCLPSQHLVKPDPAHQPLPPLERLTQCHWPTCSCLHNGLPTAPLCTTPPAPPSPLLPKPHPHNRPPEGRTTSQPFWCLHPESSVADFKGKVSIMPAHLCLCLKTLQNNSKIEKTC